MPPTLLTRTATFTKIFGSTSLLLYLTSHHINYHPVHGPSMSPALSPSSAEWGAHDSVLISRWSWHSSSPRLRPIHTNLERGDVVALRKPTAPEEFAIKRVVGLPGDRVIQIRSQPVKNAKLARKYGLGEVARETVVPVGHVWVEGDNWRDTFDSNDYGAVPINLITGRAMGIMLPYSRAGPVPERDMRSGRRTKIVRGVPPDENEEAWKQVYNYDSR